MKRSIFTLIFSSMVLCMFATAQQSNSARYKQAAKDCDLTLSATSDQFNAPSRWHSAVFTSVSCIPYNPYLWVIGNEPIAYPLGGGGRVPRRPIGKGPAPIVIGDVFISTVPGLGDNQVIAAGHYIQNEEHKIHSAASSQVKNKQVSESTTRHPENIPCEGLRLLQRSTREVVTNQPEGSVVYFRRAGKALTLSLQEDGWYYSKADQAGFITAVENGNTIWFKNLLYDPDGYFADYWIQGAVSGNTVTIPLNQDIVYSSQYDAYIRLGWGHTYIGGGSLCFYHNTRKTTATFTINGDVLTLDGASYTTNYTGQGLVAYWSDDNSFGGEAIYNTTLTRLPGVIPEAPIMYSDEDIETLDGELVIYNRTGYAIYSVDPEISGTDLELGYQRGKGYLFYDADGTTVYMRDPVYSWIAGMWIKGTRAGDTMTFPLDQYVYWDDESCIGLKTRWGTFVYGTGYTDDPTVTEVTFTIADDHIMMNDCGWNEDETIYVGLSLMVDSAFMDQRWYGGCDFRSVYYDIPRTPANVIVDAAATTATVAWQDAENTMWNVRYRMWIDSATIEYYFNDFEDTTAVSRWNTVDWDGDNYVWKNYEAEDGDHFMSSASYINEVGELTPDNWLLTPEIKLDGVVRFNAWGNDPRWANEVFRVYLFVGDTAAIVNPENDFIAISDDITATGEKTEYTFEIPDEYKGQQGYVAIRHYNVTDQYWVSIDDFYVGDPDGGSKWIYVNDLEELQAVLEGLTPETTYEVQVQAANLGGVSAWTEAVLFTSVDDQPQVQRGDVNNDTFVNINDVTVLINALLNDDWDSINVENADCHLDEMLNISDVSALINMLLNN